MHQSFRFAIASDLHIALPHTIHPQPGRFHLLEVSIPAWERVLEELAAYDLDFMILPGDLTKDGEPENHEWLLNSLNALPFPVFLIPGNHDIRSPQTSEHSIGLSDFAHYYRDYGYGHPSQLYYTCSPVPGVRLIALNSTMFDCNGQQLGRLDDAQLLWLEEVLEYLGNELAIVVIHHNVLEHLPNQSKHPMGRRYMLDNARQLRQMLKDAGVHLILTGHLHVQDIARDGSLHEITTGSLVSYPHPFRILEGSVADNGDRLLSVNSHRVQIVDGWPDLQTHSRQSMGKSSLKFILSLLTEPPVSMPAAEARKFAPDLQDFWPAIAAGDAQFHFPTMPPAARKLLEAFSAPADSPGDNDTVLRFASPIPLSRL
ncbi:MAG: metallophosphoesterase [Synechococcus sp.]